MTITIFGSSLSPFVRKALVVAAEKGVAISVTPVGLGSDNPQFRAASPFGKIPAMADGDFLLSDSTAIVTYFEAIQPEPAMIPTEAKARARVIWFEEFADTIEVAAFGKIFFNRVVSPKFLGRPGDQAVADKALADEVPPVLDYLEGQIPESLHLVEDRLTLADICVAGPFINLSHAGVEVDAARWPWVAAFLAKHLARPSFAKYVALEKRMLGG